MPPFSLNRFQFYTSGVKYMLQLLQTFTDIYRHLQTFLYMPHTWANVWLHVVTMSFRRKDRYEIRVTGLSAS
ncbi:hypothetical protein Hanom_Chr05g00417621 [Helianthus anomalus]